MRFGPIMAFPHRLRRTQGAQPRRGREKRRGGGRHTARCRVPGDGAGDDCGRPRQALHLRAHHLRLPASGPVHSAGPAANGPGQGSAGAILQDRTRGRAGGSARLQGPRLVLAWRAAGGPGVLLPPRAGGDHPGMGGLHVPPQAAQRSRRRPRSRGEAVAGGDVRARHRPVRLHRGAPRSEPRLRVPENRVEADAPLRRRDPQVPLRRPGAGRLPGRDQPVHRAEGQGHVARPGRPRQHQLHLLPPPGHPKLAHP